ncbi:sporulation protein YqfD [Neobacillus notoginsengisoli]|uniref:Sporulation protein YqfD n=1 Tax=Neobacillus notoginsengisoli TaxID=1578198 RepID=A0A417YUT5_9BACI|nr:sporulation protein YqfD [Neobacillus notoginsengisoli]RHW41019.1 sporulation protein YqfD [Neobacillus notoginsengisoli]
MKNQWMDFFSGKVTVRLSGRGNERFLNTLARNGFQIWNVRREGPDVILFTIRLRDALRIRRYVKGSECKISFIRRKGFPFLVRRLLRNSGFLIGGFLFLFMFLLLSNVVWGIEIKGAKPETEYLIRKELDKIGIKSGKLIFSLDNVDTIQKKLTNQVGAITWVGVELRGTTYHLRVVEKNEPNEQETFTPRHLIAKKEAVIVNYFIEKGIKLFDVNERVVPGQVLVSGMIGREGEMQAIAAKGEIWGETLYKGYAELPLSATFQVFNGLEQQKHYLRFGSFSVPIWGFGKVEFTDYETETTSVNVKLYKWQLPIAHVNKTMREREEVTRVYTKEEAMKKASELARNDLKKRIDEDAIIKEEKVLHRTISNGKVKLSILYTVIENIAIGQPIIQGD